MTTVAPTPSRPRPVSRQIEVVAVHDLSPSMRRVTFTGPELDGFDPGDAITVKLIFPNADPGARPHGRPFTLRQVRGEQAEIDVDFVLHDHGGVACNWVRQAAPGQRLGMFGPRGSERVPGTPIRVVLGGDVTALPAVAVILSRLVAGSVADVLLQVPTAADVQPLPSAAQTRVRWLVPDDADAQPLVRAVRELQTDETDRWWFAAEMHAAVQIRHHLAQERGVPRECMRVVPYWKRGVDEDVFHDERHGIMDNRA